jgi:glycerol uptake facilitator-like aquaporin
MLRRALMAEGLGSLLLAATVIGSGIMAERLAGGNIATALLANTAATVAMLATLIALFAPVSGAHFNPLVSVIEALRGRLPLPKTTGYVIVQIAGSCLGALLAHAMFEMPLIQASVHLRTGPAQWLSEGVATAGLILVVMGCSNPNEVAWRVAAWIGAAYRFTASTSFANPAITIARSLSNTFAGIAPTHVLAFIASQLGGGLLGLLFAKMLAIGKQVAPAEKRQSPAVSGHQPPS